MNQNDVQRNIGNSQIDDDNELLQSIVINKFEDSYFNSNPNAQKIKPDKHIR